MTANLTFHQTIAGKEEKQGNTHISVLRCKQVKRPVSRIICRAQSYTSDMRGHNQKGRYKLYHITRTLG